jgi:hypothetical protein
MFYDRNFNIGYTNITDLSPLKPLKAKQITLGIAGTKINSLKGLPNLTELTMGY